MFSGSRSRTILVFAVSTVFFLSFNLLVNSDHTWGDERAFAIAGERWILGLLEWKKPSYYVSGWTLQRTSDSPPISKIITGAFILLFSRVGYSRYPVPIRVHSSLFLAGVCAISYLIGRRLADDSVGFIAWLLLLFQPILQPNGPDMCLSSLDITCLLFICASVYFMLNPRSLRNTLISGILFGFATLSKYIAFVILPPLFFVWTLLCSGSLKESMKLGAIFFCTGFVLHLLLNPYLTVPALRNTMTYWQFREGNVFFRWSSSEIPLVQAFLGETNFDIVMIKLLLRMFTLPAEIFMSYYLVQLSVLTLLYASWRRITLSTREIFFFLWFSLSLTFMEIHSKHFPYYDIILFPSLAIFLSVFWWRRKQIGKLSSNTPE